MTKHLVLIPVGAPPLWRLTEFPEIEVRSPAVRTHAIEQGALLRRHLTAVDLSDGAVHGEPATEPSDEPGTESGDEPVRKPGHKLIVVTSNDPMDTSARDLVTEAAGLRLCRRQRLELRAFANLDLGLADGHPQEELADRFGYDLSDLGKDLSLSAPGGISPQELMAWVAHGWDAVTTYHSTAPCKIVIGQPLPLFAVALLALTGKAEFPEDALRGGLHVAVSGMPQRWPFSNGTETAFSNDSLLHLQRVEGDEGWTKVDTPPEVKDEPAGKAFIFDEENWLRQFGGNHAC